MEDTFSVLIVSEILLFSVGLVMGVIPCLVWAKIGGDESFSNSKTKTVLKLIHHWQIGAVLMIIGAYTNVFILGWGVGTTLDDLLFHSFSNYFMRRINQKN